MNKLLTFEEVLKTAKKPKVLLGNGFSMAYDKNRFSFTSLLNAAVEKRIIEKDSKIYQVFEKLKTADFENVMRLLEQSQIIVEIYEGENGLKKEIEIDASSLKDFLIKIITNNHPEKSSSIPSEQKQSCANFLKNFETIYTLNYDLLLYWAIMEDTVATKLFKDGFGEDEDSIDEGYVIYKNGHGLKILYLHGALHLFDAGDKIIKETYSKTDITLMEQTRENLDKGIYPIFVSEGESFQKMTKILHSGYLNSCYKSIKSISGDLIIFGTTLKTNDEHILNAIIESNIKNIFVGVSDEKSADHIRYEVEQYNKRKGIKEKKVILYDYRTVNPRTYPKI